MQRLFLVEDAHGHSFCRCGTDDREAALIHSAAASVRKAIEENRESRADWLLQDLGFFKNRLFKDIENLFDQLCVLTEDFNCSDVRSLHSISIEVALTLLMLNDYLECKKTKCHELLELINTNDKFRATGERDR